VEKQVHRRLAAIMFTDMVGYTALTQKNEPLALELLEKHRASFRACLLKHDGKEVKTMGDSFLIEFASALEAVRCAFSMQQSLETLNSSLPPEERIRLRIGLHVGDVIHSKDDVYGDAVNIASRVEPLAGPGEICVTQQVYDHIRNQLESPVEHLGKVTLKNVELPVDVYRVELPTAKDKAHPKPTTSISTRRIAVLPLANISPNPGDEYFADGMTEELISAVSKIQELRVISRTSAMKYKGTKRSAGEISRELNVGVLLEGSVRKAANRLRISVQLIDVMKDEQLWSQTYDRVLEDVFGIQSDIASRVAEALEVHLLAREKQNLEKRATENIAAYTLYLKGLHHRGERTEEGFRSAIRYLEEAIRKDSKFALAHAALADCYAQLAEEGALPSSEGYAKAKELAQKALTLDDTIAEAHATLGAVLEEYDWDLPGAEREFKQALGLNPNYGQVCRSYGAHLACVGRLDEAVAEIKRAQELNPIALEVNDCAAVIFNCANEYDRALQACQIMLRVDQTYFPAYQDLAEVYLQKSMFDEALDALAKASDLSNGAASVRGRLGYAYAISGKKDRSRNILHELEQDSKKRYVSPVAIALVHCGLGERDEALKWLEKACREHSGGLLSLKVRPLWASLRPDPRFKRLLKRIGLEGKSYTPQFSLKKSRANGKAGSLRA
jgi:class 3 adenylate cyclase/tetratricopeptide (TPR) repeat protein